MGPRRQALTASVSAREELGRAGLPLPSPAPSDPVHLAGLASLRLWPVSDLHPRPTAAQDPAHLMFLFLSI